MTKDINLLIKEIKKDFFVYRNGIVAAALKKIYDTDILIYGLNVPQFIELAKKYPKDLELGNCLWQDKGCRESRLFSLYILPPVEISDDMAIDFIKDVRNSEEAEFLAFRILRNLSDPYKVFEKIKCEKELTPASLYCLQMFKRNLEV